VRPNAMRGMKSIAIATLCLLLGPITAVRADVCGNPPSPPYLGHQFHFVTYPLMLTYMPRANCGFDVTSDKAFWRGYYRHYGCTKDDEIGAGIERVLTEIPALFQKNFDRLDEIDRYLICGHFARCKYPTEYDIDFYETPICPDIRELGEGMLLSLRHAYREW